jgi:hypothetical protein
MPILAPILGEELAAAIIELRDDVKREPLTELAAKLQAKEYLKTGNPIAAAEMQILRSWRSIRADWYFNEIDKQRRNQPKPSSDMASFASEVMERYDERTHVSQRH